MILNPRTEDAYTLIHEGALAFARAELQGIHIDLDYVQKMKVRLEKKIERYEDDFRKTDFYKEWQKSAKGEININSNTQLAYFLYKVKKLKPPKFTASEQGSTDEETLKELDIPEINALLEKKRYKKPIDVLTGFEEEQVNGVIHPVLNLHLARSFRSSCNTPNFQNIPVKDEEIMQICRKAIYPRPGHRLVEIDFKSIEVSVNACYNKDTTLLRYVSDPKSDMHRDMAKQVFLLDEFDKEKHEILRQATKNGFVFAEFYGDYYKNCANHVAHGWCKLPLSKWNRGEGIPIDTSAFTISDHLIAKGINSYKQFEEHLRKIEKELWEKRFPEYDEWRDRWWKTYQKYGYFDLLTGFRCSGPMDKKQTISYPAQGSAFQCNLWSFIEADKMIRKERWDTKIILQIHDSMIFDVLPSEYDDLITRMKEITTVRLPEAWKWIIVPLSVSVEACEIDRPWAEKKKI